MKSHKFHRYIGLVMLLPMLTWAATGVIFFIKPGYEGAYERLSLKTYPLEHPVSIPGNSEWREARLVKSTLGTHLLVKTKDKPQHLNLETLEKAPLPEATALKSLFEDAISQNRERYGSILRVEDTTAYTSNNIKISLDWDRLTFAQRGTDRKIISLLYKIHYLQWTPWDSVNQVLGILGLLLLTTLSILGIKVYFSNRPTA